MTDAELKAALVKMVWPIDYGTIKIQVRDGKPVVVTIERTLKLD